MKNTANFYPLCYFIKPNYNPLNSPNTNTCHHQSFTSFEINVWWTQFIINDKTNQHAIFITRVGYWIFHFHQCHYTTSTRFAAAFPSIGGKWLMIASSLTTNILPSTSTLLVENYSPSDSSGCYAEAGHLGLMLSLKLFIVGPFLRCGS